MYKSILACVVATSCVGCASITNDSMHPIKVETKTEAGQFVTGADCTLSNGYGVVNAKSGEAIRVRRSYQDLDIVCTHPDNPNATARAISRANMGMMGNVIFGGAVGAVIDHTKGTAYTYPTWLQLIFGKTLVFDRMKEGEGRPVVGVPAGANVVAQQ